MRLRSHVESKSWRRSDTGAPSGLLRLCLVFLLAAAASTQIASAAPAASSKDLKIYFVDVEGGQATLFVTPTGQSLLIDTGWPDNDFRDADRIAAAAKDAGVTKIDYVLITHFHEDHVGGAPQLAARIPIGTFIDHGENRETTDALTVKDYRAYQQLLATGKYKHIVAKPDDVLPIEGIHATAVSADAVTINSPLPGGGAENSACKDSPKYPQDQTENRRSLGTVIDFGKLRIVDLGDLTHDEEIELMCPVNKLGHADVLVVSHHGWDQSSSPALVWGLAPRVAIMDNGAKKGGSPSVWDIIEKSPGLENLWQLHFSDEGGAAHNVPAEFIANPAGPDAGNYLELTAHPDGSFTVFNSGNHHTEHYAASPSAGLTPGVQILTPTNGVNFSNYLRELVTKVRENWHMAMPQEDQSGEKGIVFVRFQIRAGGEIGEPNVEKTSNVANLDKTALNAVNASAPFAPLPSDFRGPFIELRMGFYYNVPISYGTN